MSCTLGIEHLKELIDDDDHSDSPSVFFLSNIKCFHCHVLKGLDDSLEHYMPEISSRHFSNFHCLYCSACLCCHIPGCNHLYFKWVSFNLMHLNKGFKWTECNKEKRHELESKYLALVDIIVGMN